MAKSSNPTNNLPNAPSAAEAQAELGAISERGKVIQEEITKLQNEFTQINLRAAFLQGVIQAKSKPRQK